MMIAHLRPDHHIVRDIEAAKVIKSAVLNHKDITIDPDFVAARGIKRWTSKKLRLPFCR